MKKTSLLFVLTLLFAAPLMFSGCGPTYTDDEILAMLVDGGWDGTMDISYTVNGVTYQSTSTHVEFRNYLNSSTSGNGRWCNTFSENAPFPYLSYDFTWEAKDHVIYLQFNTANNEYYDNAKLMIGSYYIDPADFTGKISTLDNSKSAKFKFRHTSSPWDWTIYPVIYPWDVYPFYPWYDPWYDPFYW